MDSGLSVGPDFAQPNRFEAFTSTEAQARIFLWGARALYVGPALRLSPHRNAVAVIALALTGEFGIANDPRGLRAGFRPCGSALIPPSTLHHLVPGEGMMAFLYLDGSSLETHRVWSTAGICTKRVGFDLSIEGELRSSLQALMTDRQAWARVRTEIDRLLQPEPRPPADERIGRALRRMREPRTPRMSMREAAADVNLSESRFRHLFKIETGVTYRRYRVWLAMGIAFRALSSGASLTNAAMDAGFASSAHFSSTFHEMFGITPSQLVRQRAMVGIGEGVDPGRPATARLKCVA
jgi:AraC-like DNA-binding protein